MKYIKLNLLAKTKEHHDIICDLILTTIEDNERHIITTDGTYFIEVFDDEVAGEVFALGRSYEAAVRETHIQHPFTFDIVEMSNRPDGLTEAYDEPEEYFGFRFDMDGNTVGKKVSVKLNVGDWVTYTVERGSTLIRKAGPITSLFGGVYVSDVLLDEKTASTIMVK